MKKLWVVSMLAMRRDELHLRSEALVAKTRADATHAAWQNCFFEYPLEEGFRNHLASVDEVTPEEINFLVSGAADAIGDLTVLPEFG